MLEIQNRAIVGVSRDNDGFSSKAREYSKDRNPIKHYARGGVENTRPTNLAPNAQAIGAAPSSYRKNVAMSRPRSISRQADDVTSLAPSYNGGGSRADQSALEHIRRIRRNMPSQQN